MHNLVLNVSDNAYAHLLYFISNIQDDVEIIKDEEVDLSDSEILAHFKEGVEELKSIQEGKASNYKSMDAFLDEL